MQTNLLLFADSYRVATYLSSQRKMERQFDAPKGAWEGVRKSDDWQITKSRWRLFFPPKARQTKKGHFTKLFWLEITLVLTKLV